MWAASDLADWWDEQHRSSKRELDSFIDGNPNLFGVIVATSVATSMELGSSTVDMLRFGQGAAEGTLGGVTKDGLRLVGLMGPLGKAAKIAQISRQTRLARLIVDPGGKICGWVSGTQALRQTGAKAFVAVDDLAAALGKRLSELGGSRLADRVELFRKLGARISPVKTVQSMEDIAKLTRRDGGVTLFNVFGRRPRGAVIENVGHAVYAFRDLTGKLRIMDRGGRAGELGKVYDNLEELAVKYGLSGSWSLMEAAVLENVFAKFFGAVSSAPVFALATYATTTAPPEHNETVAQAFAIHKTIARQGRKALEAKQPRYHTVAPGDWLSKIAKSYYGDMFKWPVVYEANRDLIGTDPNRILPGQRLLIPDLPRVALKHR